jgi:hypothetical protein
MIKNPLLILLGITLGYFFFNEGGCTYIKNDVNKGMYDTVINTTDTFYVPKDSIVYRKGKDVLKLKDTTIYLHDTLLAEKIKDVDTANILRDYYAKNVYKDSISFQDSLGWVKVEDTISENNVKSRKYDYRVVSKTIVKETVLKEKLKPHYYIGINSDLSPSFIYTSSNRKFAFSSSIGPKGANVGAYIQIK